MKIFGIHIVVFLIAMSLPASGAIKNDSVMPEEAYASEIADWMMVELIPSAETEVIMEDWMFEPLMESAEAEVNMEDWMFQPLFPETEEEEPVLEDWMFKPLK